MDLALIIVLALLGLALFGSVVLVERLLIPWHISQRVPLQGRNASWEPASCPSPVTSPRP